MEGRPLTDNERVLLDTLSPDQAREEGLFRVPAGEPGHVRDGQRMRELAAAGAAMYHPVNPYIKQYAGKLGTHHLELVDPTHPERGNHLVPNAH